eukprot:GHVQ01037473.1.p1 GENE.GHVQ01037473.1~~GHVQ01037473.1.p1  ORF type:complete len:446 (+),score=79.78 GHVQ01037473.1:291-1628(+)
MPTRPPQSTPPYLTTSHPPPPATLHSSDPLRELDFYASFLQGGSSPQPQLTPSYHTLPTSSPLHHSPPCANPTLSSSVHPTSFVTPTQSDTSAAVCSSSSSQVSGAAVSVSLSHSVFPSVPLIVPLSGSASSSGTSTESHPQEIAKQVEACTDVTSADSLISRQFEYLRGHPKYLISCLFQLCRWIPRLFEHSQRYGRLAPRMRRGRDHGGGGGEGKEGSTKRLPFIIPPNTVTAPKRIEAEHWSGWVSVGRLQKEIVRCLKLDPSMFDSTDLCLFLQCLSRARVSDVSTYRMVIGEAGKAQQSFTEVELCHMLRSLLRGLELNGDEKGGIAITKYDREFVGFAVRRLKGMKENLNRLTPVQMCWVIKCLVRFGHKDTQLLQVLGVEILKRQKDFSDEDWSTCIRAFTQFGVALQGECIERKRPRTRRDWERPPPPKMPKPMSLC